MLYAQMAQEVDRCHADDTLQLAVESRASQVDSISKVLYAQVCIADVLLDKVHEAAHHLLVRIDDLRRLQPIHLLLRQLSLHSRCLLSVLLQLLGIQLLTILPQQVLHALLSLLLLLPVLQVGDHTPCGESYHREQQQHPHPSTLQPCRFHIYDDGGLVVYPHTVTVGTPDHQRVPAGGQVAESYLRRAP